MNRIGFAQAGLMGQTAEDHGPQRGWQAPTRQSQLEFPCTFACSLPPVVRPHPSGLPRYQINSSQTTARRWRACRRASSAGRPEVAVVCRTSVLFICKNHVQNHRHDLRVARPMKPEWAIDIRNQCVKARVPFFFKQWGGRSPKTGGRLLEGKEWNQFPKKQHQPELQASA